MTKNDRFDWSLADAMTPDDIMAAALDDPDALPVDPADRPKINLPPRVVGLARALGLSLDAFADRYRLPRSLVHDWAGGRSQPDDAHKAFLEAIARLPDEIAEALACRPAAE